MDNYKYFDLLYKINNSFFPHYSQKQILRIDNPNDIMYLDNLIKMFFIKISEEKDLDIILEELLNICGIIWMYQPFYDGNTRTVRIFIKLILAKLDFYLDFHSIDHDGYPLIPIFYTEDEKCSEEEISQFKRFLIKKGQN